MTDRRKTRQKYTNSDIHKDRNSDRQTYSHTDRQSFLSVASQLASA